MREMNRTGSRRKKLILIVDQESVCRGALEVRLGRVGHTVHCAEAREDADTLMRMYAYDVVLYDSQLDSSSLADELLMPPARDGKRTWDFLH